MMIISDGGPGLKKAIEDCFPESMRQRCIAHKLRNITNKLNEEGQRRLMPLINDVYYQTDHAIVTMIAIKLIDDYTTEYPSAIKCFQEDLNRCLNFMKFPVGHQRFIRTTNLLERTFEEQKRRTKTIPRFFDEQSCIKLVYGTLIRVREKWKRIKMTDYELTISRNKRSLFRWKNSGEENFISKKYTA